MVWGRLMPFTGGAVSPNDPSLMELTGLQVAFVQTSNVSVTEPLPDVAALLDKRKSVKS